jgi:hypothetical protein
MTPKKKRCGTSAKQSKQVMPSSKLQCIYQMEKKEI